MALNVKKLYVIYLLFLFPCICLLSRDSSIGKIPLKQATFITHWLPQAQFAGYYVAYEKGIYNKYGIQLQILTGGPDRSSADMLVTDKVNFASLWLTNAIQLRGKGYKIVNIAQLVRKSALMLIAKKSQGINIPADIEGKKVGLWGGDFLIQPMAFFNKYKLHIIPVNQASSVNLFLMDGVQIASAMWYNEYHTILNSGLNPDELSTFFFSEHGLNFPEEGIYCREELYQKDPFLCNSFVKASLEGWLYAFHHPHEAVDIVLKYMKKEKIAANRSHQQWMLARMKNIMYVKKNSVDIQLNESEYLFVAQKLKEIKLLNRIPDYNSFFRFSENK